MKHTKILLLLAIGLTMLSSCSKDEDLPPIRGKWYINLNTSWQRYSFSDAYIQYCQFHHQYSPHLIQTAIDSNTSEVMEYMSARRHYAYWDFYSSSDVEYFYQWKDGYIDAGKTTYRLLSDSLLQYSSWQWDVFALNPDFFSIQLTDTVHFNDDQGVNQIAYVRIYHYDFTRSFIPPDGADSGNGGGGRE